MSDLLPMHTAELEIMLLHDKLDGLREKQWGNCCRSRRNS
jgi:hypothetical protein